MICHKSKDRVQSPDSQFFVVGNRDSLVSGNFSLENDVTASLMNLPVTHVPAESFGEPCPAKVSRRFHPSESTSSRTRCNRMD